MVTALWRRWRRRCEWKASPAFEEAVRQECEWLREIHGQGALEVARRKLARRHQRTGRRWVLRAVVDRLEQSEASDPHNAQQGGAVP